MIRINVIARIAGDKNSFADIIHLVYKLKHADIKNIEVLFIGAILDTGVYQKAVDLTEQLDVESQIKFTKKSIPLAELPVSIEDDYFLHFSVANFAGYSGLETIKLGYKTIFYNGDSSLQNKMNNEACFCKNMDQLATLLTQLYQNRAQTDKDLTESNYHLKEGARLTSADRQLLRSLLLPEEN